MQRSIVAWSIILLTSAVVPLLGEEEAPESVSDMLFGISRSASLLALKHEVEQATAEQAIRQYLRHWSPRYCRSIGVEWPGFIEAGYRGHAAVFITRCRERYGNEASSVGALLVDYVQMAGRRPAGAE